MPEFVEALRAATSVSTPIGLVAFFAVVILWGWRAHLRAAAKKAAEAAGGVSGVDPQREKTIRLGMALFFLLGVLAMVPQVVAMLPSRVPQPPPVTAVATPSEVGGVRVSMKFSAVAIGAASRLLAEYSTTEDFKQVFDSHELDPWRSGEVVDQLDSFESDTFYVRLVALDQNGKRLATGQHSRVTIRKAK